MHIFLVRHRVQELDVLRVRCLVFRHLELVPHRAVTGVVLGDVGVADDYLFDKGQNGGEAIAEIANAAPKRNMNPSTFL